MDTPINQSSQDSANFAEQLLALDSETVRVARGLYLSGFNVFPLEYGSKESYAWKRLQRHKLLLGEGKSTRHDGLTLLDLIDKFYPVNLAVMAGATSGKLAIIDCERMDVFEFIAAQLERRGIAVRGVYTNRGAHIWLRINEGELANEKGHFIRGASEHVCEIRGHDCIAIVPPSLHPEGKHYEWIDNTFDDYGVSVPTVNIVDLMGIQYAPGEILKIALHKKTTKSNRLKAETQRYIDLNIPAPTTGSRNDDLYNAALNIYVVHGLYGHETDGLIYRAKSKALASGLDMREIEKTVTSASLADVVKSRRAVSSAIPPFDKISALVLHWLREQSEAKKLSPRQQRSAAAVYAGIAIVSQRASYATDKLQEIGNLISLRAVSIEADCSVSTAWRYVDVLKRMGALTYSKGKYGTTFKLLIGDKYHQIEQIQGTSRTYGTLFDLMIFAPSEYAAKREISLRAARNELSRLCNAEVPTIERVGRGLYRVIPAAAVAESERSKERKENRIKKYEIARRAFSAHLIEKTLWVSRKKGESDCAASNVTESADTLLESVLSFGGVPATAPPMKGNR